jgi:hypothetical protein
MIDHLRASQVVGTWLLARSISWPISEPVLPCANVTCLKGTALVVRNEVECLGKELRWTKQQKLDPHHVLAILLPPSADEIYLRKVDKLGRPA